MYSFGPQPSARGLGVTAPIVTAQRPLERAFDRVAFWRDVAAGIPFYGMYPDGMRFSLWHGVNADGSFQEGTDPLTGRYWPGDATIGNRPVYYDDLGVVPFEDPGGFHGQSADLINGFGGGASGAVFVAPPTPLVPTMIGPNPQSGQSQQPPLQPLLPLVPTAASVAPAVGAATVTDGSDPRRQGAPVTTNTTPSSAPSPSVVSTLVSNVAWGMATAAVIGLLARHRTRR